MSKLVLSIHGIQTRGAWQKSLNEYLEVSKFRHKPLDYGFFSVLKLLWPAARKKQVQWFRDEYINRTRDEIEPPSAVAHSLGTYLLTEALRRYPEIRFDRVILCGSIVRPDFPWSTIVKQDRVRQVLNDRARRDVWARVAIWFIEDAGQSGTLGFTDSADGKVVERTHSQWRHSDFFSESNYRETWVPFLSDEPIFEPVEDQVSGSRNWRFLAVLAVTILAILLIPGWKIYGALMCHDTIVDMLAEGRTRYVLVARRVNGESWPDGQTGKYYECDLWLYIVSPAGVASSKFAAEHLPDPPQGAIARNGESIVVFFNYKPYPGDYAMNGIEYFIDRTTAVAETAVPMFVSDSNQEYNMGWYPYFDGTSIVHFDFAHYKKFRNNIMIGDIKPSAARQDQLVWVANHSNGALPTAHNCLLFWRIEHGLP
jgi:hypothetical protein